MSRIEQNLKWWAEQKAETNLASHRGVGCWGQAIWLSWTEKVEGGLGGLEFEVLENQSQNLPEARTSRVTGNNLLWFVERYWPQKIQKAYIQEMNSVAHLFDTRIITMLLSMSVEDHRCTYRTWFWTSSLGGWRDSITKLKAREVSAEDKNEQEK